jgi:flagellar hook protein FlgE
MDDAFGIALSGMQAAQTQLNVAANNIANANTPGFKAQQADLTSLPNGDGVDVAQISTSGNSADPTVAIISLRQSALMYGANAMVIRVQNQMYGSLLNVLDNQDPSQDQPWDNS